MVKRNAADGIITKPFFGYKGFRRPADKEDMVKEERRKYPRVPICDPISCISIDSDGNHLSQNLGTVLDASQAGIKIETYEVIESDLALLSFIDLEKKMVEITGRIVYSKQKQSGSFVSGISLQGSSADKIQFVKKLVRSYHYTKNDTRKFSRCSNQD